MTNAGDKLYAARPRVAPRHARCAVATVAWCVVGSWLPAFDFSRASAGDLPRPRVEVDLVVLDAVAPKTARAEPVITKAAIVEAAKADRPQAERIRTYLVEVDLVDLSAATQQTPPATAPGAAPAVVPAVKTPEPIVKPAAPLASDSADPEVLPVAKPIQSITTAIRPEGEVPPNEAAKVFDSPELRNDDGTRGWSETLYFWQASNLVHGPLYFEQRYVERYGYNFGAAQPAVSAAQFYGTVPLLPLKMLRHPPREPVYAVHPARPGTFGTRRPRY